MTLRWTLGACAIALMPMTACGRSSRAPTSPDAGSAAASRTPAVAPPDASAVAAPRLTAEEDASTAPVEQEQAPALVWTTRSVGPKARVVDTRDWMGTAAGSTVRLTWYVHGERARPQRSEAANPFFEPVPVELVVSLGGRTHAVWLMGNGAGPAFSRCEAEVGHLGFFYAGMSLDFRIDRVAPDRLVVVRSDAIGDSVDSHDVSSDDAFVFRVPRDVHLQQRIVVIAADRTKTVVCEGESATAP